MMVTLDEFDLKILRVLQENARTTTQELAERVGLSATPCARRVKRMEDDGLSDRYVTLLNAERLGIGLTVFVNVRLNTRRRKHSTPSKPQSGPCRRWWAATSWRVTMIT